MTVKEEFVQLYYNYIRREGSKKLLEYLMSDDSDFFTAPASTRYHGSHPGGLAEHSVNVYHCLFSYLERRRVKESYNVSATHETIAIISLLHDLCKINIYKVSSRNVKDSSGVWQSVPYYEFNDTFPYGHGEKSVYIIRKFMELTDEEAFAIRYHMGFSGSEDSRNVGEAFKAYPLALALSFADMEATFFVEK